MSNDWTCKRNSMETEQRRKAERWVVHTQPPVCLWQECHSSVHAS
jgi:hypothetical protein